LEIVLVVPSPEPISARECYYPAYSKKDSQNNGQSDLKRINLDKERIETKKASIEGRMEAKAL